MTIGREELIRALLSASELEESHSTAVTKFFLEDFDWDSVEKEKVDRVKNILKVIRNQTLNHERILNELVGKIQDSEKNEF